MPQVAVAAAIATTSAVVAKQQADSAKGRASDERQRQKELAEKQAGEYWQNQTNQVTMQRGRSTINTLVDFIEQKNAESQPQVFQLPEVQKDKPVEQINKAIHRLLNREV